MTQEEQVIKLVQLEQQIARLVEDAISEKGTRTRSNQYLHERLDSVDTQQRKLERIIYMGLGGLAVFQFMIQFLFSK